LCPLPPMKRRMHETKFGPSGPIRPGSLRALWDMTGVYIPLVTRFSHLSRWYAKNRVFGSLVPTPLGQGLGRTRSTRTQTLLFGAWNRVHSWLPLTGERDVPAPTFGFGSGVLVGHSLVVSEFPSRRGLYDGFPRLYGNAPPPHLFKGRTHVGKETCSYSANASHSV
jgi:hypothetical protein